MSIPFNKAPLIGNEIEYINDAIKSQNLSGDGLFTRKSERLLEEITGCKKVLLSPSCTAALELAALLLDIKAGDEVIMPSYTFVSTANAFVLRGAKVVFVDVEKDTMNIDAECIKAAITLKSKVIVPVHYAGVGCDMDAIMSLASEYELFVVEDAAQAIGSDYNGKALGTIGHFGTFSFHETKNITSGGEGGALLINDEQFIERAEIIREKGTNRSQFFRGQVNKYSWIDLGSSYLPSEIQAAYLYAQLLSLKSITQDRLKSWNIYYKELETLASSGSIELSYIPCNTTNNAHMFYIKVNDLIERSRLLEYLRHKGILAVFHYVPLHSSEAGAQYGRLSGEDIFTTQESERLIRLPLYYGISEADIKKITTEISLFFT